MQQVETGTVVLECVGHGRWTRDRPIEHLTNGTPRIVLLEGLLALFDELVQVEHPRTSLEAPP